METTESAPFSSPKTLMHDRVSFTSEQFSVITSLYF